MSDKDRTKIPIEFNPQYKRMVGRTVQGGMQFDVPFISQIGINLWQGGCTDGLILPNHINYIVSLYPWERYTINHKMRGELYIRMYDDPTQPIDDEYIKYVARLINMWRKKGNVLVHCQAGLNRSSLLAATALFLDNKYTDTPEEIIKDLREDRSPAVLCNKAFEKYVLELSK